MEQELSVWLSDGYRYEKCEICGRAVGYARFSCRRGADGVIFTHNHDCTQP